jgi:hypothetical protein
MPLGSFQVASLGGSAGALSLSLMVACMMMNDNYLDVFFICGIFWTD